MPYTVDVDNSDILGSVVQWKLYQYLLLENKCCSEKAELFSV